MPENILISVPRAAPAAPSSKLAVLASGRGSNFQRLAAASAEGELRARIVGLVCNNAGAGCLSVADEFGIPSAVIDHRAFDSRDEFDAAVVAQLRAWSPDLVVMAGWMRIATPTLVDAFHDRIVNIHPSLLPSFRGMNAVRQALDAGVTVAGCTVHVVRLEVDGGPIIGQAVVPVLDDDDEGTLHARIQLAEHQLYPAAVDAYLGRLSNVTTKHG